MFATAFTMKLHKFQFEEVYRIWEQEKEKAAHIEIDGLHDAIILIEHSEDKIVKILLWESEEHARKALHSGMAQESMHRIDHLLAEPITLETYDTAMTMASMKKHAKA